MERKVGSLFRNLVPTVLLLFLVTSDNCAGLDRGVGVSDIYVPGVTEQVASYPGEYDGSLFFWELRRDGTTIHILGSVHIATEDLYPLDARIMEAFDCSDLLMEEVNLPAMDTTEVQEFITKNADLPKGRVLADYISSKDKEHLVRILKK